MIYYYVHIRVYIYIRYIYIYTRTHSVSSPHAVVYCISVKVHRLRYASFKLTGHDLLEQDANPWVMACV